MHFATNESMRICWFSLFTCWCLLTVSADTLMALKHRFSQTKVLHEMPGRGDVFPAKNSMSESSEQIRPMPWNVVELCSQWCWVAKGMGRGEKMRHISLAGKLIFVLIKGLYRGANYFDVLIFYIFIHLLCDAVNEFTYLTLKLKVSWAM